MDKREIVKKFGLGGYHEIFENKKPQINADKRGFVIAYLRSFAFICGFIDSNKHQQILHPPRRFMLIFVILVIFAISGCIDENPVTNANQTTITTPTATPTPAFAVTEPKTVYVKIKGSQFDPPELKIVNGTSVKWTNGDSATYILNVDGVRSPPVNYRDSWYHTFNKTGIFEYNCSNHPAMPHGKIIVEK
ncbi:MAG: hypothetical protein WA144_01235 [Candidatus Methanoperedens sp.]